MEKKAKIIATLGPAIYGSTKLKQLVNLGVDAFRINFSHNTNGISKIVSKIRNSFVFYCFEFFWIYLKHNSLKPIS